MRRALSERLDTDLMRVGPAVAVGEQPPARGGVATLRAELGLVLAGFRRELREAEARAEEEGVDPAIEEADEADWWKG